MIDKILLKEAAKKISVNLTDTMLDKFDKYAEMLVETNKTLNLTAITEPNEIVYKHFIDSLSLLTAVDFKESAKVIDVGTGAGFPGLVLLIARPDLDITLMDGTKKRLNFISSVLDELGQKANIFHCRAELAAKNNDYREKFDVVTARAVANMNVLSEYCIPFAKVGGTFAPMKSIKTTTEIRSAEKVIAKLGGKTEEIKSLNIDNCGERSIVIIKKISQTPPKYPRASAQIAKNPLI